MTRYNRVSATFMLFSAIALAGAAVPSVPTLAAPQEGGPTVVTTEGPVRGYIKNGVHQFLGIPYAAPPIGDLRWMPPQPPKKHDLLDATRYANNCAQVTELGTFAGPPSISEDCLYLNVFTTGVEGPPKPVLVWIHGGGHVGGESNDYDASKLATGGPTAPPPSLSLSTIA